MSKKETVKQKVFLVFLFFCLVVFYGLYHTKVSISSDTTTTFPMSADLLNGNFLLRGWILGTNNFFFTEVIPYALGILVGGSSAVLINWIPGIAYATLIIGTFLLLKYDKDFVTYSSKIKGVLFVGIIVLLGIFPYSAAYTLLNANSHNNLYALLVIYLLLVFSYLSGKKKNILWATLLSICLGMSEGVTSMVLFAPIGCFAVLFFIRTRDKVYVKILLSDIFGFVISKIAIWCVELAGGFYTVGLPVGIIPINDLLDRSLAWWPQVKVLLGFAGVGMEPLDGFYRIYQIIMLLLCAWVLFSLLYYTVNIFKSSWLESVFYFISVINIAACIVTDVAVFHRYLVPGWYFGIALSLLLLVKFCSKKWEYVKGAVWILGAASCLLIVGLHLKEIKEVPYFGEEQNEVVSMLEERQYGAGYGSFWCASQVSYFSDYKIPIYPVIVVNTLRIQPYPQLIRKNWYQEGDKHFVIMKNGEDEFVDRELLIRILGEPQDSFKTENYEVYYWTEDISDSLIL